MQRAGAAGFDHEVTVDGGLDHVTSSSSSMPAIHRSTSKSNSAEDSGGSESAVARFGEARQAPPDHFADTLGMPISSIEPACQPATLAPVERPVSSR